MSKRTVPYTSRREKQAMIIRINDALMRIGLERLPDAITCQLNLASLTLLYEEWVSYALKRHKTPSLLKRIIAGIAYSAVSIAVLAYIKVCDIVDRRRRPY